METKKKDEIYEWAKEYYAMGLAILERVWCLAETTCTGDNAQSQKKMVMVTDFDGYLERCEEAFKMAKLHSDPTFEGCRFMFEDDQNMLDGLAGAGSAGGLPARPLGP